MIGFRKKKEGIGHETFISFYAYDVVVARLGM